MRKPNEKQIIEIRRLLDNHYENAFYLLSVRLFTKEVERYVKAITSGRMLCVIDSVSTLEFTELTRCKNTRQYHLHNFHELFSMLGFKKAIDADYFYIDSHGMDIVLYANNSIIQRFYTLGLLTQKQSNELAQKIPHTL